MQVTNSMQLPTGVGTRRASMPLAPDRRAAQRRLALRTFLGSRIPSAMPIHQSHAWSPIAISAAAAAGPAHDTSARPMNIVFVSAEVNTPTSPTHRSELGRVLTAQ